MGRKQTEIPGTERSQHKDVDAAADDYAEIRDERMEWTKKEVAAKTKLTDLMKKYELEEYENDDLIVTFEADVTEKVRVKRRGTDTDEAAE
jgi:hypothetical protein